MAPEISVSVFLVSYQQKEYIYDALNSALSQDYAQLEIVIADDCSTDGTSEIILERIKNYSGRHKIVLLPKEPNLGLVANMNRAMAACSGEILVMCSGDDILKSNRASVAASEFKLNPNLMAQFVNLEIIDSDSKVIRSCWSKIKERIIVGHRSYTRELFAGLPFLVGAGGSYRRVLLDYFGPLPESLEFEDSAWCIRALMLGDVLADPQIGVSWRWHGKNESIGGYSGSSRKTDSAIRFRKLARGYLQRYRFSQKIKSDIQLCIRVNKSNQKNLLNLNSLNIEEGLICRLKFHVTHPNSRLKGVILSAHNILHSKDVRLTKKIKVLSKSALKVLSPKLVLYPLSRFLGR